MEPKSEVVRLMDEMSKVFQVRKEELDDIERRLEERRVELSQKEASEIQASEDASLGADPGKGKSSKQEEDVKKYIADKKKIYDQQLADFAEQLSELEAENQRLREKAHVMALRDRYAEDTDEQMKSAYHVLSEQFQLLYRENSRLQLELAHAEAKTNEQRIQLEKSSQLDTLLENLYNKKIESLQKIIELKDNEIEQLRADNQFTLESLGITSADLNTAEEANQMSENNLMDMDKKQRVIQIAATIREKDSQIDSLKSQLLEATEELEKSASLLEAVTRQQNRTRDVDDEAQLTMVDQLNVMYNKNESLERELAINEQRIADLERNNRHLEYLMPETITEILQALKIKLDSGLEGNNYMIENLCQQLNNLLNEVRTAQGLIKQYNELKELLSNKDAQILRLVNDLRRLHTQFNLAVNGIKTNPFLTNDGASSDGNDDEFKTASEGIDNNDIAFAIEEAVENYSELARKVNGEKRTTTEEKEDERNEIPEQGAHLCKTRPAVALPGKADAFQYHALYPEKFRVENLATLEKRVRHLEEENTLLELAMKEILLCIRWSDSQCGTLLIECPSLERLCQIIEARYVAESSRLDGNFQEGSNNQASTQSSGSRRTNEVVHPDTFKLVVLKSELDLLRGQNDQLRLDIKIQRQEYLKLVSNSADTAALKTSLFFSKEPKNLQSSESDDTLCSRCLKPASQSDQEQCREDTREKNLTKDKVREVECQTERGDLLSEDKEFKAVMVDSPLKWLDTRNCRSCYYASDLIQRLLRGVVRLETRVSICNKNYFMRFQIWNKLINELCRDLGDTTRSLKEAREKYHLMRHEKFRAESELQLLEQQVANHLKTCPKSNPTWSKMSQNVLDPTIPGGESLTNKDGKNYHMVNPTSARVMITLLKSIIGCLQARLVFKDDRISTLEMYLAQQICAPPA